MVKPTRRLIKARRELNLLISMIEKGCPSLQLINLSRKIQSNLNSFNREILSYHFFICIRKRIKNKVLLIESENIAKILGLKNSYE